MPAKASEGEVLIITVKEVLVILMAAVMAEVREAREVRILTVVEAGTFMVAVAEAMTFTVAAVDVMVDTLPLETMRIIRAIIRWYRCPEHRKTVKDQDAVHPSVLPRRDRGLVFLLLIQLACNFSTCVVEIFSSVLKNFLVNKKIRRKI